jgi:hypothetical protein
MINSPYIEGKWVPWSPVITQPGAGGAAPSGLNGTGSKYTVVNGVFYGFLNMYLPNNSNLGGNASHWELQNPIRPITSTASSGVLGNGFILLEDASPLRPAKLSIVSFYTYPEISSLLPILPYYNAATMDNPPDTTSLYEWWMNGQQSKVEAERAAWLNIATNFSATSQRAITISAYLKYIVRK